jgi:hypothetical protein
MPAPDQIPADRNKNRADEIERSIDCRQVGNVHRLVHFLVMSSEVETSLINWKGPQCPDDRGAKAAPTFAGAIGNRALP